MNLEQKKKISECVVSFQKKKKTIAINGERVALKGGEFRGSIMKTRNSQLQQAISPYNGKS